MTRTRVVLVRPWTDAHGGTGCCSGEPRDGGVCLDRRVGAGHLHDYDVHVVAETYRLLQAELDDVDVQIVGAGNTAYLLPTTYRAVRRRAGVLTAVRDAARSTTAGAVLVNGERVGDIADLGPPRRTRRRSRLPLTHGTRRRTLSPAPHVPHAQKLTARAIFAARGPDPVLKLTARGRFARHAARDGAAGAAAGSGQR